MTIVIAMLIGFVGGVSVMYIIRPYDYKLEEEP